MLRSIFLPSSLLPTSVFSGDRLRTRPVIRSWSPSETQEEPLAKKLTFSEEKKPRIAAEPLSWINVLDHDSLGKVMLAACRMDKTSIRLERVNTEWAFASSVTGIKKKLEEDGPIYGLGSMPPLQPVVCNRHDGFEHLSHVRE